MSVRHTTREINTMPTEQTLPIPVKVGDRVTLFEHADVLFEDEIAQFVPDTGLLRFEDSDVGRAEFLELLDEADGYQVVRPEGEE